MFRALIVLSIRKQPLNAPVASQAQQKYDPLSQSKGDRKTTIIYWTLKVVTMLLCLLMALTAIIGIEYVNDVQTSEKLFVATYMLFFSTLLFVFELVEVRPIEWIDHLLRRNFGFLYGVVGKSLYIIFIAVLSFGLGDPQSLTFATGSSLCLFGILMLVLYLKYPEMFETSAEQQQQQQQPH